MYTQSIHLYTNIILYRVSTRLINFCYKSSIIGNIHACSILVVRKVGHLNIKTKMFDFEVRVLIGWLTQSIGNQNACLKIKHFCLYVKFMIN